MLSAAVSKEVTGGSLLCFCPFEGGVSTHSCWGSEESRHRMLPGTVLQPSVPLVVLPLIASHPIAGALVPALLTCFTHQHQGWGTVLRIAPRQVIGCVLFCFVVFKTFFLVDLEASYIQAGSTGRGMVLPCY